MFVQNQIKRALSQPPAIAYVAGLLHDGGEFVHRTELADFLCAELGFHDVRGHAQRHGCLKALRELEAAGHFTLPEAQGKPGPSMPKRLPEAVPDPAGVPAQAGEVRRLALLLVDSEERMRIWNEMMIREHPRGHGPLVGRQVRYLIESEHGWLGAMGFAAPALQLADRDDWIGWTVDQRRDSLHTVVNMSRFLIRPSVHCANLASRLLAMAAQRLPEDFERRYGYRPFLLESFVDSARFAGTCYRAANWIRVGRTQGRGRQDRFRQAGETVKDIYVYPLEKDFRSQLGLAADAGRSALRPADGLEAETWAEKEFGGAPLGDERLSKRLVNVAGAKAGTPGRAFCGVAQGDAAAVKGYYRLPRSAYRRYAGGFGGDDGPHPATASGPHHTAHAGAAHRAVRAGRQRSELQRLGRVYRAGRDRQQPDGGQEPRIASAYDVGDLTQRTAAGRAEGAVFGPGAESAGG